MIGVPAHGEGEDDHSGSEMPDVFDDRSPGLFRILQASVGQSSVSPLGHPDNGCRSLGLLGSKRGAAAGAGLAGGEVQNSYAISSVYRFEQSARAGELDVVSVGGEGQDVYGHGGI